MNTVMIGEEQLIKIMETVLPYPPLMPAFIDPAVRRDRLPFQQFIITQEKPEKDILVSDAPEIDFESVFIISQLFRGKMACVSCQGILDKAVEQPDV